MNNHDLLEGLGSIDPALIEAADQIPEKPRGSSVKRWCAAAASFAVLLAAVAAVVSCLWPTPGTGSPPDIHLGIPEKPTLQQAPDLPAQKEPIPQSTIPVPSATPDTVSYLTLDVNPSVQFAVEDGLIVDCFALNDDGERILSDLQLGGMTIEGALPLVLEEMIDQGYLAAEDHAPVMLLSTRGGTESQELLHTAVITAKNTLTEKEVESFIVTQEIDNSEAVERLAKLYGVSVGKMQYVLDILEEEAALSLEEASTRSIVELFGMDIERRLIEPPYKVGDYDEYGEKVLFVGSVESYVGYVPWEELSEEYKNQLRQMYTPEALAILAMPRVWTTMPNVVGLPADEALALLYSRNIAPYICYEDSAQARQDGYTDGTCFMQDIPQGRRWNSDACVHIWILISEGEQKK